MKNRTVSPLIADLMLLLAVLSWGVSFPVAKLAMNDWGDYKFLFLAGRFWLAFAIFLPFAIRGYSWKDLVVHLKPGFWVGITLAGAFGFQYGALKMGSSGEVAFITTLSSVFVPVGMWLVFRKHVEKGTLLGLLLATAGAVLIEVQGKFSIDGAGMLALLAAVGMAADLILVDYFMGQKRANQTNKYANVPFLTIQFLVLAIATTLVSLFTEVGQRGLPAWSSHALFAMVFMSVVATAAAFLIQTKYQPKTRPDRAALIFTLESPLAALFSYLLLHEVFSLRMATGATMIVLGVACAEFLAARRVEWSGAVDSNNKDDELNLYSLPLISGSQFSKPPIEGTSYPESEVHS